MTDLTSGMSKPCLLDIKLGSTVYNPKKVERQKWKMGISTSHELSFRLCGYSVYKTGAAEPEFTDKYYCRQVTR